jgi:hypothetical protein
MIDQRVAITDGETIRVQARSKLDPKEGVQNVLDRR